MSIAHGKLRIGQRRHEDVPYIHAIYCFPKKPQVRKSPMRDRTWCLGRRGMRGSIRVLGARRACSRGRAYRHGGIRGRGTCRYLCDKIFVSFDHSIKKRGVVLLQHLPAPMRRLRLSKALPAPCSEVTVPSKKRMAVLWCLQILQFVRRADWGSWMRYVVRVLRCREIHSWGQVSSPFWRFCWRFCWQQGHKASKIAWSQNRNVGPAPKVRPKSSHLPKSQLLQMLRTLQQLWRSWRAIALPRSHLYKCGNMWSRAVDSSVPFGLQVKVDIDS